MKMNPMDLIHPDCPNFRWYEVWKSETAARLEIDNESTDPEIQANAQALVVNLLQPLRDEFGATTINSWCRLEPLEKVITRRGFRNWCEKKGLNHQNPKSWNRYFARKSHPKGQAIDIEFASISNDELYNHVKNNYDYDQLIREFPVKGIPNSGWVHLSWAGENNRKQSFTIGAK